MRRDTLEELYRAHYRPALLYTLSLCGDPAQAEDSVSAGSVGERLACALEQAGISARVALCSSGDTFTPHGSVGELKRLLELDGAGLAQRAMEVLRFDKTAAGC